MNKRGYAALVLALVLMLALLTLSSCGEEQGRKARETVEQAGENAADFAEGFCGAIVLAPLVIGLAALVRRNPGD